MKAHSSDTDGTYTVSTALKGGMVWTWPAGRSPTGPTRGQLNGGSNQKWSGVTTQKWRVSARLYVTLSNASTWRAVPRGTARTRCSVERRPQPEVGRGRSVRRTAPVSAMSQSLLEVAGWSTKNGANVDVWTSNGGANQQWKFKPVGRFRSPRRSGTSVPCHAGARACSGGACTAIRTPPAAWR